MASEMVELVNPANGQTFQVTRRQADGVYSGFKPRAGRSKSTTKRKPEPEPDLDSQE